MPQRVSVKSLRDICLKYAAENIDDILKFEGQFELHDKSKDVDVSRFQDLPDTLFHILSYKALSVGSLHDGNIHLILSQRTRNIKCWDSDGITDVPKFLQFLQQHCTGIVMIDLRPLLGPRSMVTDFATRSRPTLIGLSLSFMVNLEWIDLTGCCLNDECLKYIGANCTKLKHLNLSGCNSITNDGIRALCDPNLKPYGKCTHLKELHMVELQKIVISPEVMCLLLLNCPDLEYLEYDSIPKGLAAFIAATDSSVGDELWKSEADRITLPCNIIPTSSIPAEPHERRVFKLKYLEYQYEQEENDDGQKVPSAESFFSVLPKYCPFIEELCLATTPTGEIKLGDLHGIFCLPLKLIWAYPKWAISGVANLPLELLLLLRSVGSSLTTLRLEGYCVFDLKVISRECPNLTTLSLDNCDTTKASARWPDYPIDELDCTRFKSLTELQLFETPISDVNFVNLLFSPNLKILSLSGYNTDDSKVLDVIRFVLIHCEAAFCKLEHLSLSCVEMDKETLSALLDRAVPLIILKVWSCFYRPELAPVAFDEQAYFEELIKINNWELLLEWSVDNSAL